MNPIKESYSNEECPDCSTDILNDIDDNNIDAWLDSLPEPSEESNANYQRNMDLMLKINQEAGVFQDVEVNDVTEEDIVANKGKYIHSYVWQYGQDVN